MQKMSAYTQEEKQISLIDGLTLNDLMQQDKSQNAEAIQVEQFDKVPGGTYVITVFNDVSFRNSIAINDDGTTAEKGFIHTWFQIRYYDEQGVLQVFRDEDNKITHDAVTYSWVGELGTIKTVMPLDIIATSYFEPQDKDRTNSVTESFTFVFKDDGTYSENMYTLFNNPELVQNKYLDKYDYSLLNKQYVPPVYFSFFGELPAGDPTKEGRNCTTIR